MSQLRLGKPQKALIAIIETEGGQILSTNKGGDHIAVDYTFDGRNTFTQRIPYGSKSVDQRWSLNFRTVVRKSKRQHLEN
jgi:hypothetical protein